LSLPFAAGFRAAGISTIDENGRYVFANEVRMQKSAAAGLMALAVLVFYVTSRLCLPIGWSLLVATTGGLGTLVWSIASRSLQSHAWVVLLLSFGTYLLLRAEVGRGRLRPVVLGTILSLTFYVRPIAAATIAPLFVFVTIRYPRQALWLGLTGAVWLGLFLLYSQVHFSAWVPDYYAGNPALRLRYLAYGLSSNLVSPSRGLFVYSPFLLVVVYLLVTYRRHLRYRGLLLAMGAAFLAHTVVASCQLGVQASAYGPRFLTDIVPLLGVISILALRAALAGHEEIRSGHSVRLPRLRFGLEACAATLTVILGVLIHGAGAISPAGMQWNSRPVPLSQDRMRVFDWRRPQWLCSLFPELLPAAAPGSGEYPGRRGRGPVPPDRGRGQGS
jgi:hypothetical protein